MGAFSGKKILLLGFIIILLIAIPATVYLVQQNQENRSHATPSTNLSFSPATKAVNTNDTFSLDVMIDPGSNQISAVQLYISYDPTKLATSSGACQNSFCATGALTVQNGPNYTQDTQGHIAVHLDVGGDPTKTIQTPTKIATVTFKALAGTGSTATQVSFETQPNFQNQTIVASVNAPQDLAAENVLQQTSAAQVSITQTAGPTATPTLTPTSSLTPVPGAANQPPSCTSLNIDRTPSGTAPFSITFTAIGSDTDGTVQKVTFNFGDGPVQDVVSSGGIGTKSVSVQVAHAYNNAGVYHASALLTDSGGGVSASTTCIQTITVLANANALVTPTIAVGGPNTSPTVTIAPSETPTPIPPTPTIEASGPGEKFVTVGLIGAILSIAGGLLFFAL